MAESDSPVPSRAGRAVVCGIGYALVVLFGFGALRFVEPVRVAGGSMRPALEAGDLVLVLRGGAVENGDIVLIARPGKGLVLHRVIAEEDDGGLRTKGDANDVPDIEPTSRRHVRGRVVAIVPFGAVAARLRSDNGATLARSRGH